MREAENYSSVVFFLYYLAHPSDRTLHACMLKEVRESEWRVDRECRILTSANLWFLKWDLLHFSNWTAKLQSCR